MNKIIALPFGILIAGFGSLLGYSIAGGRGGDLFHISELMVIASFVAGGVWAAFGPGDAFHLVADLFRPRDGIPVERLARNILVCEAASRYALFGGATATLMGFIITLARVGGDAGVFARSIGASLTGMLSGVVLAGIFFQPLKFHFRALREEQDQTRR